MIGWCNKFGRCNWLVDVIMIGRCNWLVDVIIIGRCNWLVDVIMIGSNDVIMIGRVQCKTTVKHSYWPPGQKVAFRH